MNFCGTIEDEPDKKDSRRHAYNCNSFDLIAWNAVHDVKRASNKLDKKVGNGDQQDQAKTFVYSID
jgi:hypothetical protein